MTVLEGPLNNSSAELSDEAPPKGISRKLLPREVADYIKREIQEERSRPGDRVLEIELARRLGISQSPVREAFRLLEAEGILIKYPYQGSFVVKLSADDVRELGTLRSLLETYAGELAAPRLDQKALEMLESIVESMKTAPHEQALSALHLRFHKLLTSYSRHRRIIEILNRLESQIETFLSLTQLVYHGNEAVAHEHRIVLDVLKSGPSSAQIRRVLKQHFDQAIPLLMEVVAGDRSK
jgi:DNA-binding GntR family transcriptional regulator